MNKFFPLIILALLAGLGWFFLKKKAGSPGQEADILSWLALKYQQRKIDYDAYTTWYSLLGDGTSAGSNELLRQLSGDYQDGKMVYEAYLGIYGYLTGGSVA